jgi:hypothetical protein
VNARSGLPPRRTGRSRRSCTAGRRWSLAPSLLTEQAFIAPRSRSSRRKSIAAKSSRHSVSAPAVERRDRGSCRTVSQCGRAGNSIAIVGVVRDRGVAPEGAQTAAGRTHRTCLTRGPVVLVAEAATGRRRCSNTRWHTHRSRQRGSPGCRWGATADSSWLGSSVHSSRGPRRHRAGTGFRRHRPRPCGEPIAFCRRGWRDD